MKSESNNGYIRANVIPEQNENTSPSGQDVPLTGSPLQVTYGPTGSTTVTSILHPTNTRSQVPGITRATSVTRRRRGASARQQMLGIFAVILLAISILILLILVLNTTRECVQEPRPNVCMSEECVRTG